MLTIELVPSLSNCIHTVTKREYADTLGQLLSGKSGNRKLKRKLELLTLLLKEIDFKQLRQESERHLMGGEKVRFFSTLKREPLNTRCKLKIPARKILTPGRYSGKPIKWLVTVAHMEHLAHATCHCCYRSLVFAVAIYWVEMDGMLISIPSFLNVTTVIK